MHHGVMGHARVRLVCLGLAALLMGMLVVLLSSGLLASAAGEKSFDSAPASPPPLTDLCYRW